MTEKVLQRLFFCLCSTKSPEVQFLLFLFILGEKQANKHHWKHNTSTCWKQETDPHHHRLNEN